jgi:hypothetical protein
LLDRIVDFVAANKFQGITIDFENVPPGAHKDLEDFLSRLSAAFAPHDWIITQSVPFDDEAWPYRTYADIVDYTILMAYDQNEDQSGPGPVAGQSWFEGILDKRMKQLSADSTIIAIGSYGYDWVKGGQTRADSFEDAMTAARDNGATVQFDPPPTIRISAIRTRRHPQCLVPGWRHRLHQIHTADPYRPAGYALWKLGFEDPSVLPLMGKPYNAPAPDSLKHIVNNLENVDYDGQGEFLRVEGDPALGARSLTIEKGTGDIIDESYDSLPTSYIIRRGGRVPGKLALTFDDGPDPDWTPTILQILKDKHVPAAFFMIGANMEAHPGLSQAVVRDGHEVGNHTYTHPNLAGHAAATASLELNASQRLFQALTGRSLMLFRSPYLSDSNPSDADEIEPIKAGPGAGLYRGYLQSRHPGLGGTDRAADDGHVYKALNSPNPDLRGNIRD